MEDVISQDNSVINQTEIQNDVAFESIPSGAYGRFAANFLDGICIGLLTIPVIVVSELILFGKLSIDKEIVDQLEKNVILQIITITGIFSYYLWFNVNKGATPGKSSYKLTIVKYGTTARMGYGRALVRELAKHFNYVPFFGTIYFLINAAIILFSKQKRTLYDLIAGTQVVKR